jgi:hypothetical protein
MTPNFKRLEYGALVSSPRPSYAAQYKDFRYGVQRISGRVLTEKINRFSEDICAAYLEL